METLEVQLGVDPALCRECECFVGNTRCEWDTPFATHRCEEPKDLEPSDGSDL